MNTEYGRGHCEACGSDHGPLYDCQSAPVAGSARIDTDHRWTHGEEIAFFNWLIIDLKLQQLGKPEMMSRPIDDARLLEGDAHVQKLTQCRERAMFTR